MEDKIFGGICPHCNKGSLFYYWGRSLGEEIYTCRECDLEFTLRELQGYEESMWRTDLMQFEYIEKRMEEQNNL